MIHILPAPRKYKSNLTTKGRNVHYILMHKRVYKNSNIDYTLWDCVQHLFHNLISSSILWNIALYDLSLKYIQRSHKRINQDFKTVKYNTF